MLRLAFNLYRSLKFLVSIVGLLQHAAGAVDQEQDQSLKIYSDMDHALLGLGRDHARDKRRMLWCCLRHVASIGR